MSKLWVYGDSFANSENGLGDMRTKSWSHMLSTHFNEYESHASWGIGNDWIMEKFVQNNPYTKGKSDRDIGIFLFSHPRRMRLPIHEGNDLIQSHSYTNEDYKNRGDLSEVLKDFQSRLRKNGWLRQVQEQVMFDRWRWKYMIDLQLHTLNTYSKHFDMLIVHTGFADVAEIATKSSAFDHDLKAHPGFCWLDLIPIIENQNIFKRVPDNHKYRWIDAPLDIAPCHMSPRMNKEYYKIMLAACTTHKIKKHLNNGWISWSDAEYERNKSLPWWSER